MKIVNRDKKRSASFPYRKPPPVIVTNDGGYDMDTRLRHEMESVMGPGRGWASGEGSGSLYYMERHVKHVGEARDSHNSGREGQGKLTMEVSEMHGVNFTGQD
ncbi:hypothetical protein E2C01_048551 [Portunus trituberculatus]|uniref:Uncharacterized protein n=1 Tax=Portunus trituberculatus TaxID=210409 RepID=A0A5B7GBY4_PORTR|nr:hypothetical protein [Portunus trituberculatus]